MYTLLESYTAKLLEISKKKMKPNSAPHTMFSTEYKSDYGKFVQTAVVGRPRLFPPLTLIVSR